MASTRNEIDVYDDHPSLADSLEDFEVERSTHSVNASAHSVIRSEHSDAESERSSAPWSPPYWPNGSGGDGWYNRARSAPANTTTQLKPPSGSSRSSALAHSNEDDGDNTILPYPADIPLPSSPERSTPIHSLEPTPETEHQRREHSPSLHDHIPAPGAQEGERAEVHFEDADERHPMPHPEMGTNFIRFAMRAEVQQRTEPIEQFVTWIKNILDSIFANRFTATSFLSSILLAWILWRALTSPPSPLPGPDFVKASGLARTFKPLMEYSDTGMYQVHELQDTSIAVWDLGESVRAANITSGPMIVRELDGLSANLGTLSMEITRFCAHVGGDVDSVILVTQWAKLNLESIGQSADGSVVTALDNVHSLLSSLGLLESSDGSMSWVGKSLKVIFGLTPRQKSALTLHHTFNEVLNTLEDAIKNELNMAAELFKIFESIDKQFDNLHRVVAREQDQQERELDQELASLWVQLMSSRKSVIMEKFQRNKDLLSTLRTRTVSNKKMLAQHNHGLVALKAGLEVLRGKLVSPLIRSNGSGAPSIEKQIECLEGTYRYLTEARQPQKDGLFDSLRAFANRQNPYTGRMESRAIEGGY